jgi:ABC-type nitrate/sulfonate/bicarbonate transport system substrate-binding protein
MNPLDRRAFVRGSARTFAGAVALGGGLPILLSACGDDDTTSTADSGSGTTAAGSGSLTKQSLQLSWILDAEFAGYYIAKDRGYYAEEGLDLEIIPGGPTAAIEATVASGKAKLGLSVPDLTALAMKEGGKFKVVGAQYQKSPLGIMSLKDKGILEPKDLIGKKVGVPATNRQSVDALLKVNDIDAGDVQIEPYSFDPTPVANGELDAALAFVTTDPFVLQEQGFETNNFLLADWGYRTYNDTVFVTEDVLAENFDMVVGFLRASIRGWQDNKADTKAFLPLQQSLGKDLGLSEQSQLFQNEAQIPLMENDATKAHGLFWMDDEGIKENVDAMTSVGIEVTADFFTRDVLEKVYGGKNTVGG